MKRSFVLSVLALSLCSVGIASGAESHAHKQSQSPATLLAGIGKVHHAVSTKNSQAQAFFDQGLALVYGFNHDEAKRSFERAAQLDPNLAMAWWGIALTLGPNYNLPVDPEREKAGYEAAQHAVGLAQNASEPERAYIAAVAERYSDRPDADLRALDLAYKDAMRKVAERYPDDLDAATLYAESAMDLHPWQLWTADGKPAEGTEEILTALQSVLARDPNHLGANHYYIHAVEASRNPERALASAVRLEKLAPAAGHLVHMPAHIFSRVGDHAASAHANEVAAAADEKYLRATHVQGVYPAMYYSHNLHFLAYAATMEGKFDEAKRAADKLVANVRPHVKEMAMLEGFAPTPMFVLLAFERWNDVEKLPTPDAAFVYTTANWHFARAIAAAGLGRTADAEAEAKQCRETFAKLPPDASFDPLNPVAKVAAVQDKLLDAVIARSRRDFPAAIEALKRAVAAEDALNYSEPPSWYPPVRPQLGRALLDAGRAPESETAFRAALDRSPRYFRALTGLRDALKAQNKDATQIEQQLAEARKSGDAVSVAARGK